MQKSRLNTNNPSHFWAIRDFEFARRKTQTPLLNLAPCFCKAKIKIATKRVGVAIARWPDAAAVALVLSLIHDSLR